MAGMFDKMINRPKQIDAAVDKATGIGKTNRDTSPPKKPKKKTMKQRLEEARKRINPYQ